MGGFLTEACYYACSLTNPNNLAMCASGCCAQNPDPSDALCSGLNLPQSPAETSPGVIGDIWDTITGSYPGGSNADPAAACASNPTFTCWWQQNGTTALVIGAVLFGLWAVKK